jgi:hypothetical protein
MSSLTRSGDLVHLGHSAAVFSSYEDVGAGLVDRGNQRLRAAVVVEQHDHAGAQRSEQVVGVGGSPTLVAPNTASMIMVPPQGRTRTRMSG